MLIKLSRDSWLNLNCDNVNRIDIKPDDQLQDEGFYHYYVTIETDFEIYYSDNFSDVRGCRGFRP